MRTEVRDDLTSSSYLWRALVWPAIAASLRGGELMSLEHLKGCAVAHALDVYAGIDGFHLHQECGMRGLAHRAQVVGDAKPYNTFTIRSGRESGAVTELEKRTAALQNDGGWLFPALTIQTYAKTWQGPLVSVGIAQTADIIDYIQRGHATTQYVRHRGSAEFKVCKWDKMKQLGYSVKIICFGDARGQNDLFDAT